MRTIVTADVHGNFKALKQCLKRSSFNYDEDTLICLGDTCDGLPQTKECFDELLKIKHLIYVMANHDFWCIQWMYKGNIFKHEDEFSYRSWYEQGGKATIQSYGDNNKNVPEAHKTLLKRAEYYYVDNQNRLFVHGGYDTTKPIELNDSGYLMWDRSIIDTARILRTHNELRGTNIKLPTYNEVYIGHTHVGDVPINIVNLCCMDTGAGWKGRLTFKDIDTKEIWQSDTVEELYGKQEGR